MAKDGNVTGTYAGNRTYTGQCTFTQGVSGFANGGDIWYVDSSLTASDDGKTWDHAFITIAEAVTAASAYDTILIKGTDAQDSSSDPTSDYTEEVTIPATKMGLRIIGCGNSPEGVLWENETAETVILTINAKDCLVANIRFRPNGATSANAIFLAKNEALTANASGAIIRNCIFRSTTETALAGIETEGANDVLVEDCVFTSVATGILQDSSPNSVTYRMRIRNNLFDDKCTNGIVIDGRSCDIRDNSLASDLTVAINTYSVGSAGSKNIVRGHSFAGAEYETQCVGSTSDLWFGNISLDVGSSAVTAAGGTDLKIYPQT